MPSQTINPDTFRDALTNLRNRIRKCRTTTISLEEIRLLAKSVANLWFKDVSPFANLVSNDKMALQSIDLSMNQLLSHTLKATKRSTYLSTVNLAVKTYEKAIYVDLHKNYGTILSGASATALGNGEVANALAKISDSLHSGYQQVLKDLSEDSRLSWRGTANELREVLRELLHILAPDSEVVKAQWYKEDTQTKKPTQAQRARYILEQRSTHQNRAEAAQETITLVEESISKLVRKTYERANNATHTPQDKDEVKRILDYFNVLAKDLLGLS